MVTSEAVCFAFFLPFHTKPLHLKFRLIQNLRPRERVAFKLHLFYSFLEGVSLGIIALNEFVFVKSLQGSEVKLGLLFQFSMLVFLFLIVFNELLRRIPKKRLLLRYTVLITRLPLLLIVFFPHHPDGETVSGFWHALFLALFFLYYLGSPIVFPSVNLLLKQNYQEKNFGRLYGYATSLNKIVMLAVTFVYGLLLDYDSNAYTYVLPLVGVFGVMSGFVLSRIPYSPIISIGARDNLVNSVRQSLRNMGLVLKQNIAYRHFEIGFMLYGFAFMSTTTVIVLFFTDELQMNYSSIAFYKNVYNIGAIVLLPIAGRWIGLLRPRRFSVIAYASLAFYLVFLILTARSPNYTTIGNIELYWLLLPYLVFHSVFAATMPILWNIGSSYFSGKEEVGLYQEIHLSLTGFRALFSPLLGVFFYLLFGSAITFAIGIVVLLVAIIFMMWSYKNYTLSDRLLK